MSFFAVNDGRVDGRYTVVMNEKNGSDFNSSAFRLRQDQVFYFQGHQQQHLVENKRRPCIAEQQQTISPFYRRTNPVVVVQNKLVRHRPRPREILEQIGFKFALNYKLGKGHYSKVLQGFYQPTCKKFAIKVIDMESVTPEFCDKFLPREMEFWKKLYHPNICYLHRDFVKFNYQFAIMELAEHGDLLTHVQKNGPVPEQTARRWMIQLVDAIGYLHLHKIAHRDLKMENMLLFSNGNEIVVKISDFGFCKQSSDLSTTHCGSKSYSAPEILQGLSYDTFKADIWSLGVVAFVMVTNTMPYSENVAHNMMIVEAQRNRSYCYPQNLKLSTACRSTIDVMMTFRAAQRPNIKECCYLIWFCSAFVKPNLVPQKQSLNVSMIFHPHVQPKNFTSRKFENNNNNNNTASFYDINQNYNVDEKALKLGCNKTGQRQAHACAHHQCDNRFFPYQLQNVQQQRPSPSVVIPRILKRNSLY